MARGPLHQRAGVSDGLRLGLYLPQMRMDWGTIERRVRIAEEVGFDSVWLMDHFAPPMLPEAPCLEALTLAAALAVRTERVHIGHLVLCDPVRHPGELAKAATTIDAISNGRFELGIGWGSVPRELRAWGVTAAPARDRAARLGETLEVLELLFTGEEVSYAGHYHRLDRVQTLPRPVNGRIPIHVGGGGATTMPLVRRYADWWNCPPYAIDRLSELREAAGDARLSIMRPVGLAARSGDRQDVVDVSARRFGSWGGVVAGTADEVAAALAADVEHGAEMVIVTFTDFAPEATLRRFAEEVVPALR